MSRIFSLSSQMSVGCWITWYPLKIHLVLKSREISFADNILLNLEIILIFLGGNVALVQYAKFQKIWQMSN